MQRAKVKRVKTPECSFIVAVARGRGCSSKIATCLEKPVPGQPGEKSTTGAEIITNIMLRST